MSNQVKAGKQFTLKKRGAGGKVLDETKVTVQEVLTAGRGSAVIYTINGKTGTHREPMGSFLKRAA